MDNIFCGYLREARNTILLPWAMVLEGHGWWHIFTGIGAYYFIIWRVWLTQCLDGNEDRFMLQWPSALTSFPKVVPRPGYVPEANSNGHANGKARSKSRSTRKEL
jgi:dihydroceramidase